MANDANAAERYFEELYDKDEDLLRVEGSIKEAGMPEISVASGYGRLLTLLVSATGAKSALEIGALGGYSGICLARGLPEGGKLVSLELKQSYADLAAANLAEAGYGNTAHYIVGDASESLNKLMAEGEKFDFFFIDADKENYPRYLETCIALANDGAIVAADNTLLRGRTLDEVKQGPSVVAVRQFNAMIAKDKRLQGVHLPAYDGLAIARIRSLQVNGW
ncbi:O-methyltransferase [Cohnella suwonensis]|uniref:O-methyltransferase n=1 Tax=Cohnella suwonensis TaxID=696072 RepID=A0ABW0M0T8_9BACL